jgi:hypothetical protein
MFAAWCDAHDSRVLVTPSQITEIENDDGGIVVTFRCACGHLGTWVTGRRASEHRVREGLVSTSA